MRGIRIAEVTPQVGWKLRTIVNSVGEETEGSHLIPARLRQISVEARTVVGGI
jgi:hypothetical protein